MVTGYQREHAAQVLRATLRVDRARLWSDWRVYDAAMREALIVLWEASDRIREKRLRALIPGLLAAMEKPGHLVL